MPDPVLGTSASIILFRLHHSPRRGRSYHSRATDEEAGSEYIFKNSPIGKLFTQPLLCSQEMLTN